MKKTRAILLLLLLALSFSTLVACNEGFQRFIDTFLRGANFPCENYKCPLSQPTRMWYNKKTQRKEQMTDTVHREGPEL